MEGAATLFVPDSPTALDLAATRLVLPAMAAADHPITSFVLCIQLQPADARPAVEALIRELGECTPFRWAAQSVLVSVLWSCSRCWFTSYCILAPSTCRFHNHDHQEDTEDPRHPHFKQIEFRQLESGPWMSSLILLLVLTDFSDTLFCTPSPSPPAQKAYATVQGVQLRVSLPEGADSAASPIYLSLSVNQDPALDVTPPAEGTLLHVSELPPSYCSPGPLYELFKPFGGSVHAFVRREKGPVVDKLVLEFCPPRWDHAGPIYRIETGPRLGTARVTYYNKESSRAAEEDLHYSDLDGVTIIVRKPSIHDAKDSFKSSFFPIMPATSRRTFSSPSSALVIPDFVDGHLAGPATRDGFTNAKKAYNYASGHRATCGIGPVPYGLSAKAEPFTPRNPSTASENHPASQTQLKEASPNPLVFRSVSQPIKLADPCQLILQNVPLSLNAQSLYSALRNTLLTAAPEGTTVKLLEATVASDTATGISQGIGIIRLENKSQTDIAMKVLDRAYLVGYEEEGALPLQVKLFEPKGLLEHALQQRQERQSLSNTKEQTHLASPSMVSSISTPSTTTSNSKRNKHRNLLSTVLNDLDLIDSKSLFTSDNEKNRLLDLLMEKLPEDERKRCILEEKFLIKRCSALKMLFWDDEDNQVDVVDATNISDGRLGEVSKVGEMRNGTSDLDIGHGEVKPASGEAGSASPTQVYDGKEDPSVSDNRVALVTKTGNPNLFAILMR